MIRRKFWGLPSAGNQYDFAFFHRILRSQPSSRPGRQTQARIGWNPAKVDINQTAFVIDCEGIPSDHRTWRRCGIWPLRSYEDPVRRDEARHWCGIDLGSRARSRDQIMTVPTSKTNRPAISRRGTRTYGRSATLRRSGKTSPDQIGNRRRVGDRRRTVPRWLNIACGYWLISGDFLLKIADRDIERALGDEIGRCVIKARLGQLPISGRTGEIC